MLRVEALTKRYAAGGAGIAGVSFEVKRGEFFTLLGPSGCGKTTTLRCIAGLEQPSGGEIEINGRIVYSQARGVLVPTPRRDIAMVFQSYAVWPHMTVGENVAFPLEAQRLAKTEIRERVARALSMVGLSAQADRRTGDTGHFGLIASENDPAIFAALFAAAENWLRQRGRARVLGPFDLSINEEIGVLVDGFDTPPMLLMPHNPRWLPARIEEQGYTKAKDVFAYLFDNIAPKPAWSERIEKRPLPSGVTYVHDCPVGPYKTVHLVSRVDDMPVAVLYVPGKQVLEARDFQRGGWHGRIVPLQRGTLVMLTDRQGARPFDTVAQGWRLAIDGSGAARVADRPVQASGLLAP